MIAKALRKNTICPTGATSPSWRTSADITANSKAETILKATPLNTFINVSHRARQCIAGVNPARFPRLPSETKVVPGRHGKLKMFLANITRPCSRADERTQQPIFAEPERVAKSKRTPHHRWFRSGGRAREPR